MDYILGTFFAHEIAIKMLHFQTKSYSSHIVLDKYLVKYRDNFDLFMEVLQSDFELHTKKISLKVTLTNDDTIVEHIEKIVTFLRNLSITYENLTPELASIRDDMVAELKQLKYLLHFR